MTTQFERDEDEAAVIEAVREKLRSAHASLTSTEIQLEAAVETVAHTFGRREEQRARVAKYERWLELHAPVDGEFGPVNTRSINKPGVER